MKKTIVIIMILAAISLASYYFLSKKYNTSEKAPVDQTDIAQDVSELGVPAQIEQSKPEKYVCNNVIEIEWFPGRQDDAIMIGKALSDQLGCTVRVLPAWNRRIGQEEPKGSDVRYFWEKDREGAQAMADFVKKSSGEQLSVYAPYPEKLTDNSGGRQRSRQGYLEIWLKKK